MLAQQNCHFLCEIKNAVPFNLRKNQLCYLCFRLFYFELSIWCEISFIVSMWLFYNVFNIIAWGCPWPKSQRALLKVKWKISHFKLTKRRHFASCASNDPSIACQRRWEGWSKEVHICAKSFSTGIRKFGFIVIQNKVSYVIHPILIYIQILKSDVQMA